jgi:basic amino acid/polyamine antiporter, APA family
VFVVNSPDMSTADGHALETKDDASVRARRPVGPFALLALGVNGIVGVGIFFTPATVAKLAPGASSILVFGATGLALVPVALAYAVLGRRFDEDGGPVVFARAAFGEFFSFLVGWLAYVSAILSASAVMVGLVSAVAPSLGLQGAWALRLAKMGLVTGLALVVGSGISISALTWTTLTILKLLPLLALVAVFVVSSRASAGAFTLAGVREISWARAALTAMFTYQGFEIVPVIAGQVRSSKKAVPFATVGSLVLASLLYIGLMAACVAALPDLASSAAPLADAARVYGGASLSALVSVGTSVSALGIALGMMVTTPRYLSAFASGQRNLFDLDRFAPNGVPFRALIVTWALVTGVVVLGGDLSDLFALSSLAVLTQFGVSAASLVALGLRRDRGLGPAHAALALPTLALGLFLAGQGATPVEGLASLAAVAIGLVLFRLSKPR